MYRQWAVVNIFMMFYLQLVQDSSDEHGPVKVGELNFEYDVDFVIGLHGRLSLFASSIR